MTQRLLLTFMLTAVAASPLAAQTSQPQPIARTAFMQRLDSDFVTVDANKDGFTDKTEIEAAQSKAFAARKAAVIREREATFKRLDADKNGSLTLTEFNSAVVATQLPKPNAAPVLGRLDTNKDGKVSLAENRVPAMAQFDRADGNKDGTLSVEEQRGRPRQ